MLLKGVLQKFYPVLLHVGGQQDSLQLHEQMDDGQVNESAPPFQDYADYVPNFRQHQEPHAQ